MSHNTFSHPFRVTSFGESQGAGTSCVIDDCPPLIALDAADIQVDLDRRRPGTSRFTTQRREPDEVKIPSDRARGVSRLERSAGAFEKPGGKRQRRDLIVTKNTPKRKWTERP